MKKKGQVVKKATTTKTNGQRDAQLRQIAEDLYKDNIFCDRHCRNPDDIPRVFMPIMFLSPKQARNLAKNAAFIYEYKYKASPRSINGMPMFTSLNYLDRQETVKMFGYYKAIKDAVESVKKPIKASKK